jgi:hypothetical protein
VGISSLYLSTNRVLARKSINVNASDCFSIIILKPLRLLSVFLLLGLECSRLSIGRVVGSTRFQPLFYVSLFPPPKRSYLTLLQLYAAGLSILTIAASLPTRDTATKLLNLLMLRGVCCLLCPRCLAICYVFCTTLRPAFRRYHLGSLRPLDTH